MDVVQLSFAEICDGPPNPCIKQREHILAGMSIGSCGKSQIGHSCVKGSNYVTMIQVVLCCVDCCEFSGNLAHERLECCDAVGRLQHLLATLRQIGLPLFVLSLMFCFAFIVYFLRYTEAVGGGPTGYPAPGPTMVKAAAVDQWIQAPIGLDRQPFWQRQATSFLVVILALSVIGTGMFAFESAQFNCAVYIAIAIVIFSLSIRIRSGPLPNMELDVEGCAVPLTEPDASTSI